MAVVKVKSVKTGLDKTIKYIINPDKTEGGRLVSVIGSAATAPEGIARAMTDDLKATRFGIRSGTVLGRHVIQSFDPEDDLTPEEAHLLGKAFATEITGGNHKYVIATHTDRNHIHNHIVICNASDDDHTMLRMQKSTLGKWRNISDRLCKEHGLGVIRKPKVERHGRSLEEIYSGVRGDGIKDRMRTALDLAAAHAESFPDFTARAARAGIEVSVRGRHLTYTDTKSGLKVRDLRLGQAYDESNIMAKLSRAQVIQISFDAKLIARRDKGSVTVCLPGTRRGETITIPLDRCVRAVRTWRAYIGVDNDQTITDQKGRYLRTIRPEGLYRNFAAPDMNLASLTEARLPIRPGVSDAQRRYYAVQGHRLDQLRDMARQLSTARKWTAGDGDLGAAIERLERRVRDERADFQARVVAASDLATDDENEAREILRDVDENDRRLGQLETELASLKRLSRRTERSEEREQETTRQKTRKHGRRF